MNTEMYEIGLKALEAKDYKAAARDFAIVKRELDEHDEHYNSVASYLGLSQVLISNRNGLLLCRDAASSETRDGDVFLNLACAEWQCNNRKRAIDAIRRGCEIDAENERLQRASDLIDSRKRSLFQYLPRRHSLNRAFGRLFRRTGDDVDVHSLLY
ncbi:MAG: hypothetical protein OEY06_02710 [Gammaproteobacteria bacterium]|nr:hypothetical protein [Gammaproteobacteria bacterium]